MIDKDINTERIEIRMKDYFKEKWAYFAAIGICIFIVLLHCITRGIWIFGENTLFVKDAGCQYIYYMSEIWNKFHSGGSFFFSWSVEAGIDSYLNMMNYVLSPFNLIVWILPRTCLENAVQFVMFLRWILLSFSMVYYILHTDRNKIKQHRNLVAVLLGVSYACSAVMLADFVQISWLDVFFISPYLLLMFERLIDYGKWKGYYILLAISMILNLYLAYVMCLFLLLWFFNQTYGSWKEFFKKGLLFAGVSLLATFSSMISLLVSMLGIQTRYVEDDRGFDPTRLAGTLASLKDWMRGSYMFDDVTDIYTNTPHIYMGVFSGILLLVFLFVKIDVKTKVKRMITALCILAGFFVGGINYIWHAFVIPNGYYYRFAFVWVLFAIYVCMETIPYLQMLRIRWMALISVAVIALFSVVFFRETDLQEFYVYLIAILLFAVYMILLVLHRKKSITTKSFLIIVSVLTIVELSVNAYNLFGGYDAVSVENRYENGSAVTLAAQLPANESGDRVAIADVDIDFGMWTGLNTVKGFASVSNAGLLQVLTMLGASPYVSETGTDFIGASPLLNYMLNIKYGIGRYAASFSDTEQISSDGNMNLYEMQRTGAFGYMVNNDVETWNPTEIQLFDGQNDFAKKATGIGDFMTNLPFDGVVQADYGYLRMDDDYQYSFVVSQDTSAVMLTYEVPEDMDLYLYSLLDKTMSVRYVKLDGDVIYQDGEYYKGGTIHIGNVKKGQVVTMMQMMYGYRGEEATFSYQFASFDDEQYQKVYDKLSESLLDVEVFEDTYVKGTIEAKEDGVMMTSIPAKDGFTVYVDGEETDFEAIGNAFIGIPLKAGTHTVEFKYMTPYFKEGLAGSLCGIIIFIVICIVEQLRKKKKAISKNSEAVE
jgi:uncharacterized membrane protein YfhO